MNSKLAYSNRKNTDRLRSLDGHELVVALLPADIAERPVVPGVLGDVADLVDRVVMQEHLCGGDVKSPCVLGEKMQSHHLLYHPSPF